MARLDILPPTWKPWHPIVFGLLAGLGFKLVDPVWSFLTGLLER